MRLFFCTEHVHFGGAYICLQHFLWRYQPVASRHNAQTTCGCNFQRPRYPVSFAARTFASIRAMVTPVWPSNAAMCSRDRFFESKVCKLVSPAENCVTTSRTRQWEIPRSLFCTRAKPHHKLLKTWCNLTICGCISQKQMNILEILILDGNAVTEKRGRKHTKTIFANPDKNLRKGI